MAVSAEQNFESTRMPPVPAEIRELLLQTAQQLRPTDPVGSPLQLGTLFAAMKETLGGRLSPTDEQEILTQWHDLMRTGYFAWGLNLGNPNPPFFHFTDRGRRAIARLSRDPGNPAGYLEHVRAAAALNPISESYLVEGLACFTAGLHKAAAVMMGAASE